MSVSITVTPLVTSSIPGDQADENTLPSALSTVFFSFNINFIPEALEEYGSISSVSCSIPYNGVNFSVVNNNPNNYQVNISGTINNNNLFIGEYFKFYMPDGTVQTLDRDEALDFKSVVEWSPPVTRIAVRPYIFSIVRSIPINITLNQYAYWEFNTSLNAFQAFVDSGAF